MSDPPIRVGDAERQAAMSALDEHLKAGRLDPDEYGDRYAVATSARTREELAALFTDLPEPHGTPPVSSAPSAASSSGQPASRDANGPLGGRYGVIAVSIAPIVAVVLFLLTRSWLWFLLIPAAGAVVYGNRQQHRGR